MHRVECQPRHVGGRCAADVGYTEGDAARRRDQRDRADPARQLSHRARSGHHRSGHILPPVGSHHLEPRRPPDGERPRCWRFLRGLLQAARPVPSQSDEDCDCRGVQLAVDKSLPVRSVGPKKARAATSEQTPDTALAPAITQLLTRELRMIPVSRALTERGLIFRTGCRCQRSPAITRSQCSNSQSPATDLSGH